MGSGFLRYELPLRYSDAVLALQKRLVALNHLQANQATGLFGPETRQAVRRFQNFAELAATGEVDNETDMELGLAGERAIRVRPTIIARPPVWNKPLPSASPKRVILHWTGGGATASPTERKHYHFLVQQDGKIVQGVHGIEANDAPKKGHYAAHTKDKNTKSIGVSLCGMAGAEERPFKAGKVPFKKDQLEVLTRLVAQLCAHYNIPVTRKTVLGHGEVQDLLGVAQEQKWDPMVLPWDPDIHKRDVGDIMRAMVQAEIDLQSDEVHSEDLDSFGGTLDLKIGDEIINGGALDFDCAIWTFVPDLATRLGWTHSQQADAQADDMPVTIDGIEYFLPVRRFETENDGRQNGFIRIDDLAEELNLSVTLSEDGTLITLDGNFGGALPNQDGQPRRQVTVRAGDTLIEIARRELGDAALWDTIRDAAGHPFTDQTARELRAGQHVIVPSQAASRPAPAKIERDDVLIALFGDAACSAASHPLNQDAAREAAHVILPACFEYGVMDLSHIAYIFATAQHETNFGRLMVEKWTESPEQKKYEANASNSEPGDGKRFKGRGYVQLTFRENYAKFTKQLGVDIEAEPERAAEPEIAAKVLVLGMDRVGYRSPKLVLPKYGVDGAFDFEKARQIVNADMNKHSNRYGTSRGKGIGRHAVAFRHAFAEAGINV